MDRERANLVPSLSQDACYVHDPAAAELGLSGSAVGVGIFRRQDNHYTGANVSSLPTFHHSHFSLGSSSAINAAYHQNFQDTVCATVNAPTSSYSTLPFNDPAAAYLGHDTAAGSEAPFSCFESSQPFADCAGSLFGSNHAYNHGGQFSGINGVYDYGGQYSGINSFKNHGGHHSATSHAYNHDVQSSGFNYGCAHGGQYSGTSTPNASALSSANDAFNYDVPANVGYGWRTLDDTTPGLIGDTFTGAYDQDSFVDVMPEDAAQASGQAATADVLNDLTSALTSKSKSRRSERKLKAARATRARSACTLCDATFARNTDLERHMKKHQPGASIDFQCSVPRCGFSSYRKDKLDAHVKCRHPGAVARA